jgi:hypothetical protein
MGEENSRFLMHWSLGRVPMLGGGVEEGSGAPYRRLMVVRTRQRR